MKKVVVIFFAVLVLFSLTGCNEEQKSALQIVIDQGVQDEDVYTPHSYQNYVSALENAKTVKEKTFASKKEITNAQQKLQTAIEELYIKPDKTELRSLINKANNINENNYTTASCSTMNSTLASCLEVLNNENSMQQDVDHASDKMNSALNGLVEAREGVYEIKNRLPLMLMLFACIRWSISSITEST